MLPYAIVIWSNRTSAKHSMPSLEELQTRLMHEADAFALCFHPARQELAVALANGMVILWDLVEGRQTTHGKFDPVLFAASLLLCDFSQTTEYVAQLRGAANHF